MDKPPPLWDNNAGTQKKLRLPNTPTTDLLKTENKTENHATPSSKLSMGVCGTPVFSRDVNPIGEMENLVINSRLSADAPEFYPSYYVNPVAPNSVQDRLKRHKSVDTQMQQHPNLLYDDFMDSPDGNRLKQIIMTLTKDPGQFGDLLELFTDTLYPYFENILVLSRTAQILVSQAINYSSFRYTAARLCCYIEQYCPEFRAELHLTCKKELDKNSNKSGLLLFVAELYTQLHYENIYGTYLIDAFKHLLAISGNENIKCICQALKLTGYSLELYDKKAFDDVFIKLQEVKPSVTGTARSLIDSVIELRGHHWGHDSPNNSSLSASEPDNTYWSEIQKTVFYGADGSRFSSEENEFLANNLRSADEYLADVSDPDELCDPEPEMDEEIQAAFRDFVKLSKR